MGRKEFIKYEKVEGCLMRLDEAETFDLCKPVPNCPKNTVGILILRDDRSAEFMLREDFDKEYHSVDIQDGKTDAYLFVAKEMEKSSEFTVCEASTHNQIAVEVLKFGLIKRYREVLEKERNTNTKSPSFHCNSMPFEEAIIALKYGFTVRRKTWADKGIVLLARLVNEEFTECKIEPLDYSNVFYMLFDTNTNTDVKWTPTVEDVLANDWELSIKPQVD